MHKVLRLDISPYQKQDFHAKEKALVEKLGFSSLSTFDLDADILIIDPGIMEEIICTY